MAVSFEDFAQRLLQRGITVKESRGRLSYLTPDRTKPITARKLGDDFDRAAVGAALERNAARPSLGAKPSIREQLRQPQGVQRMVDIEAKKAEGMKSCGARCQRCCGSSPSWWQSKTRAAGFRCVGLAALFFMCKLYI